MMSEETKQPETDLPETKGGAKPEAVEDRPNVGVVAPDDYPETGKVAGPVRA